MLTSAGQRGDGERCRALGIRGYLTKPCAPICKALGTGWRKRSPEADVVTRHTIAESRRACACCRGDNPVNRRVAVAMLVKRGHQVHIAATAGRPWRR
jgi:CheY-like chemotaxis protein